MGYTISGTYLADCSCDLLCPCPVDGKPNHPDGQCWGNGVFHVEKGSLDDVDLSGVDVGMTVHFPSNFSAGNLTMQIFVDPGASDEQANALERIFSGQAGGPFGEMAPLFSDLSVTRSKVSYSDGDQPSASIEGVGDLSFQGVAGPDGSPTVVRNAPFGFAPEFRVGRSGGEATIAGQSVEMKYAEAAAFEYSSEAAGEVHPRA
jgi:hypothetical protein